MAEAMKTTIGGYKLRSLLQTGAVSQVYEVVEPTSHRHFAMKVLLPEQADNKSHRAQLFHEAEIGIKMRHENVINILKVSKDMQTPHFIMEFFPSGSLRTRLLSRDPKDKEFIKNHSRKIFKQMATGLAYMNASGYVHCDVKADNVLVNQLGQTKMIDFAISKKMAKGFFEKLFAGKQVREGTKSYMSPEQILKQSLDGRSDVYSFGATWYELATGRPPFRAASQDELLKKHLQEKPAPLTMYNADVTDDFSNFVLKMMEKKKENRPENFHKILMDVKKMRIFKSLADEADEEPTY